MANINRDLIIQVDVKTSTLIGGDFNFFITDKHTSNFFVKLVISMSNNPFIKNYISVENASDYKVELVMIKPNNEVLYIDGSLLSEEESLFLYDLTEEQLDIIGTYNCEFRVKSTVNNREEVATTNPFTFEVLPSIVNSIDGVIDDVQQYPIYEELLERVEILEEGGIEVDLDGYATKDYVDREISTIELMPGEKGDKGDTGEQGPKGDKGDTGEKGADGLTTSINVNGTTYTQSNGLITLPNYPKEADLTDYATKEYVSDEVSGYFNYSVQTETWTFELADGTTVTKRVVIK